MEGLKSRGYAHRAGVQSNMSLSHDFIYLYHHSYLRWRNDFLHATQPYNSVQPPLTKELLNATKEVKTAKCGQHGVTIVSEQHTMLVFKRKINHYSKKTEIENVP